MAVIPYFEVGGNRYEIRRSRYLLVEWDKIRESSKNIADDDPKNLIKANEKMQRLRSLKSRVDELYGEYMVTFSDEAKAVYERAQAEYDKLFEEIAPLLGKDGVMNRVNKAAYDNIEKLVIVALQYDSKGNVIRKKEEAEEIWCSYVDEVGQIVAESMLDRIIEHISGADESEEDSPFLAQAKARAEQQAENRKAGLAKIKK